MCRRPEGSSTPCSPPERQSGQATQATHGLRVTDTRNEDDAAETGDAVVDADAVHLIASEAAIAAFRHHPGMWTDALPAALDTYRQVTESFAPPGPSQ